MSWQGYIRKQAPSFDEVIVCTTAGLEPLYADFTKSFITHNVGMIRDCAKAVKIFSPGHWSRFQAEIAQRVSQLCNAKNDVVVLTFKDYVDPSLQSFICYGDALRAKANGDVFDLLIHARNKKSQNSYYDIYNWPIARWNDVMAEINKLGLRVGAIGTHTSALLPKHAEDLRGIPLVRLMDAMSASTLVAGPSSGPMHLAALCGLPRLVWGTTKWSSSTKMDDTERYTHRWNPFDVPCIVIADHPDPTVEEMLDDLMQGIEGNEYSMNAGAKAAKRMREYWAGRRQKQGRNYVSRHGKNSDHQVDKVIPKLHELLGDKQFKQGIDYGCGWGRFSKAISEHCEQLRGVDLIADFRNDLPNTVTFQTVEFPTKIDLPNGSVDLFVAVTSLQHIVDEHWFIDVMGELRRVLATGATVLIIDDNGSAGQHVKPRGPKLFAEHLDLDLTLTEKFDMDHERSHHIVLGVCRE